MEYSTFYYFIKFYDKILILNKKGHHISDIYIYIYIYLLSDVQNLSNEAIWLTGTKVKNDAIHGAKISILDKKVNFEPFFQLHTKSLVDYLWVMLR